MSKYDRILIGGIPCLQGSPPLRDEPLFYQFPVGTRFWKIGYERNSSCRETEWPTPAIYSGKILIGDTDFCAFRTVATRLNPEKEFLFEHDETVYMLFFEHISAGEDPKEEGDRKEIWQQDFDQLVVRCHKALFEIDNNGHRETVDLRTDYWKKRHDKPKKKKSP